MALPYHRSNSLYKHLLHDLQGRPAGPLESESGAPPSVFLSSAVKRMASVYVGEYELGGEKTDR